MSQMYCTSFYSIIKKFNPVSNSNFLHIFNTDSGLVNPDPHNSYSYSLLQKLELSKEQMFSRNGGYKILGTLQGLLFELDVRK
jgi:hypothetical protein